MSHTFITYIYLCVCVYPLTSPFVMHASMRVCSVSVKKVEVALSEAIERLQEAEATVGTQRDAAREWKRRLAAGMINLYIYIYMCVCIVYMCVYIIYVCLCVQRRQISRPRTPTSASYRTGEHHAHYYIYTLIHIYELIHTRTYKLIHMDKLRRHSHHVIRILVSEMLSLYISLCIYMK
jgi:hypothetical protein